MPRKSNKNKFKPLFSIGDLIVEHDGLDALSGLIVEYSYDEYIQDFLYSIKWQINSYTEPEVQEKIIKWRVDNKIWNYYPIIL